MTQCSKNEREIAVFSASSVLAAIGDELSAIKRADGLTFDDLGAILGKSGDQALKYCAGTAAMDVIAYARGRREWGGRFTGALDRLIAGPRPVAVADRTCESKVLRAALALSIALADDERIKADEVRANRAVIEDAYAALGNLLALLAPREVA